jgi:hypothetical protein
MTTDTEPTTGKHWPGCVEPRTQRRVNSIGAVWVTCRGCGAYWRDADGRRDGLRRVVGSMTSAAGGTSRPTSVETAAENRTPVEIVAPPSTVTGWVCREHLDQPVTPRGSGCPTCAADLKRRQPTRRRYDTEQGRYR